MLLGFETAETNLKGSVMKFGSGGQMIHCQFVFENYDNVCASAWELHGIGFRTYEQTVKEERRWAFVNFGNEKDEELWSWFRQRIGTPYDLGGLFTSFIVPMKKRDSPKMFCSEVCYTACQEVLKLNLPAVNPAYLSPQGLYDLITKGKL